MKVCENRISNAIGWISVKNEFCGLVTRNQNNLPTYFGAMWKKKKKKKRYLQVQNRTQYLQGIKKVWD